MLLFINENLRQHLDRHKQQSLSNYETAFINEFIFVTEYADEIEPATPLAIISSHPHFSLLGFGNKELQFLHNHQFNDTDAFLKYIT